MKQYRDFKIFALEIVEGCNLKCSFCARNAITTDLKQLDISKVKYFVESVTKKGFLPQIALTGGEPLLHDDIIKIITEIENNDIQYSITTNGTIINLNLLNRLSSSKYFKHFIISVDSVNSRRHDKVRGKEGAFKKTFEFINTLSELNIEYAVNMTVTRETIEDIYSTAAWAKKIGAKDISIATVKPSGRGDADFTEKDFVLFSKEIVKCKELIDDKFAVWVPEVTIFLYDFDNYKKSFERGDYFACGFGNETLHIDFNGNIKGCTTCELVLGYIYTDNFDFEYFVQSCDILQNMTEKTKYKGICGNCEYFYFCGGCRCRAYAVNKDIYSDDPYCPLVNGGIRYEYEGEQ